MWTVIYDDPKRKTGASHSLHVTGCADIARAAELGGNPHQLAAETFEDARIEARFQGLSIHAGSDLGDVAIAPCAAASCERERCKVCGMTASIDPWLHSDRYKHRPVVERDGVRLRFSYDTHRFDEEVTDES